MATRVWAVHDNGHDLSKAGKYGEVRCLFKSGEKINVFAADALARDVREKLEGAEEGDHLILTGSAVANCLAFCYLMKKFARVNVLIWSFRDLAYEPRTIVDA